MIDEEVSAVLIAVLVVVAVFAVSQTVLGGRVVEPFSELGVLGENVKIGDYPSQVATDEEFNLYLYVGNHEGRAMYYRVLVKLGDRESNVTDEEPLEAPILDSYESILMHGGNVTVPMALSLEEPGHNQRLVFELHRYNAESEEWRYHNRWCQLWLNVTSPG